MRLALFDLDHTLLPIDSDYEWGRFLGRIGVVDPSAQQREHDRFYEDYKAGTLDIDQFLAFQLAPLAGRDAETLARWHQQFMREVIEPAIRPQALALVGQHLDQGDLCAVVTATNDFVTAPIARRLGVPHLVATTAERNGQGFTGRAAGLPNFREGKVERTRQWLESLGHRLGDFENSWFYSDSANDLPLLSQVTHPVATNPDPRLLEQARSRGWPVLDLFAQAQA